MRVRVRRVELEWEPRAHDVEGLCIGVLRLQRREAPAANLAQPSEQESQCHPPQQLLLLQDEELVVAVAAHPQRGSVLPLFFSVRLLESSASAARALECAGEIGVCSSWVRRATSKKNMPLSGPRIFFTSLPED